MESSKNGVQSSAEEALAELQQLRSKIQNLEVKDSMIREKLMREARSIMVELETPWNTIERICGFNAWESIAIDIAANAGIFEVMVGEPGPVSVTFLAEKCNAEPLFVARLMRCLAAFGAAEQYEGDLYGATNVSQTFATVRGIAAIRWCLEFAAPAWLHLPSELQANSYRSLTSGNDTVYNKHYNAPGATLWQILGASPYVQDAGIFMANFNWTHQDWLDFYPVQERLVDGASGDPAAVFMVDLGGFTGSQALAFRQRFDKAAGRFVVEDLPDSLPKTAADGLELLAHDFFQPQPAAVHGARLFYMRYISHDWSQELLIKLLKGVRTAMKSGYSRLIIHDWIVPETNPPPFMTSQDLNMMTMSGEERTEVRFREAIDAAGLVVTGIWDPKDRVSEAVIECQVA